MFLCVVVYLETPKSLYHKVFCHNEKKFTLTFLMKNDFGTFHNAPKTTAITLWKTIIIKRKQKCLALPLLSLCARNYWGHNFTYGDFFRRNPKGRFFLCFRVSCPLTKLLISFITCRKIVRILPYLGRKVIKYSADSRNAPRPTVPINNTLLQLDT